MCLIGPHVAVAQQPPTVVQPAQPAPPLPPAAPGPTRVPVTGTVRDLGCGPGAERATPTPDYRLGPGDLVEVQMVGRLEVTKHQVSVGPDGVINVPPIGGIDIRGLTLGQANQRIAERVRSMFRFVETTIAVAMPRCLEIVLSGDIERPGTMLTPATRRLQDVILAAGGVAPRGSARHIRLTTGQQEREVDLLRFELTGDLSQNPLVEDGLRVHVPPRGVAITLSGAVRRPGEYEIDDAGSLRDLLGLVGGLHPTAARRDARLTRLGPDGRKQTLSVDLQTALVAPSDVRLQSGDVLFVPTVAQLNDIVEVRGAFAGSPESGRTTTGGKPTIVQRFELATGDRVRDLVTRAGGPAPFADLRLGVVERRATTGPLQRVPVDLHRLLVEKDEAQNIELHNGDVLVLPIIEDKVYVLGEVKQPGAQDFRQDLTIREYLALAGGPGNRAKIKNTTVTFRDGKTYAMESTPPLEPGAVVTVPEVSVKWWQDYVQIAGVIAGLITAYTGIFILFGGNTYSRSDR